MDFITDLPPSKGHTTIWVVVDRFSKLAHFVPLKGLPTAAELAHLFIKEIFRLHGLPAEIVSDRGVQFVAKFWRALCNSLQVQLNFSTAYHPQSNGSTERVNQDLETFLRLNINSSQDDWVDYLPWAEFAHNNSYHSSTGVSPFFTTFGLHPRPPEFRSCPSLDLPAVSRSLDSFANIWKKVHVNLRRSSARYKRWADRKRWRIPKFCIGDQVWLSTRNLRLRVPTMKFAPRFIVPYSITKIINPVSYKLKLPPFLKIPASFHVSLLKPLVLNRFQKTLPKSPRIRTSRGVEFEVKKILDSRIRYGRLQYLLDWKGYGPEERSWEYSSDVHASSLIHKFHSENPDKPKMCPEATQKRGGNVTIRTARMLQCSDLPVRALWRGPSGGGLGCWRLARVTGRASGHL